MRISTYAGGLRVRRSLSDCGTPRLPGRSGTRRARPGEFLPCFIEVLPGRHQRVPRWVTVLGAQAHRQKKIAAKPIRAVARYE
jgi:hypothetical protein